MAEEEEEEGILGGWLSVIGTAIGGIAAAGSDYFSPKDPADPSAWEQLEEWITLKKEAQAEYDQLETEVKAATEKAGTAAGAHAAGGCTGPDDTAYYTAYQDAAGSSVLMAPEPTGYETSGCVELINATIDADAELALLQEKLRIADEEMTTLMAAMEELQESLAAGSGLLADIADWSGLVPDEYIAALRKFSETVDEKGVFDAGEELFDTVIKLFTFRLPGAIDKDFAEKSQFNPQCWLLANVPRLAYHSSANLNRNFKRDEGLQLQLVTGPPGSVVSKMVYHPSYSTFYNMSPDKLSLLQPSLALYKVLHEDDAGKRLETPQEVMIPFPQHILDQDIAHVGLLKSHDMRGGGVGIKDFSWSYQGSNPPASRRDIIANLTLHFQSFNELLKPRVLKRTDEGGVDISHTFKYIDLATRVGKDNSNPVNENSQYYVLKAVVGWGWGDAGTDNFTEAEKKAIKASKMTLMLTIIDHEFAVEQDGTLDFKISYRAYIEGALDSPNANVLASEDVVKRKAEREGLRAEIQELASWVEASGSSAASNVQKHKCSALKSAKANYTSFKEKDKMLAHASLIHRLIGIDPKGADNRIYFDTPDSSELKSFIKNGAAAVPEYDPWSDDYQTGVVQGVSIKKNMGTVNVPFVYLGDLIDACISNMTADGIDSHYGDKDNQIPHPSPAEQFKNMRIVLGPIEITDHVTGKLERYNLADIPISINYFSEWFMREMVDKDKVEWQLFPFIRSLIKSVVLQTLRNSNCFGGSHRQKAKFNNLFLTAGAPSGEPIARKIKDQGTASTRLNLGTLVQEEQLFTMDTTDVAPEDTYMYLVIYATDPIPRGLEGDLEKDALVGIQHFQIGVDRGSVKNISFSKTDAPGLREANFFRGGYDGMKQFKNVYSVSLSMFGDSKLFPGQMVYVNPAGLGYELGSPSDKKSMAALLGIGGYYMIIKVDNSIRQGDFDSTVDAKWVLSGIGTADTSDTVEPDSDGEFSCAPEEIDDWSGGGAPIDFSLTSWIPDSVINAVDTALEAVGVDIIDSPADTES